ncbi:MAG: 50S ribosomal protein L13 [Chlamydiae bacterium]|nr:50S ribosomal protein L13 [Chlamydiota bacterium]MBI3277675.1 50S ribosomal protein L13 [Chlamydiota bacterium]
MMKTFMAKSKEIERKWYLLDASNQVLGRLATRTADLLRGKGKTLFTPHVDCGDYVVIVNAEKIRVTGKKSEQLEYITASGYPGGQKVVPYRRMQTEHPEHIIEHAVRGMVPSNPLGRQVLRKLKVYTGSSHPHSGQNLESLKLA